MNNPTKDHQSGWKRAAESSPPPQSRHSSPRRACKPRPTTDHAPSSTNSSPNASPGSWKKPTYPTTCSEASGTNPSHVLPTNNTTPPCKKSDSWSEPSTATPSATNPTATQATTDASKS